MPLRVVPRRDRKLNRFVKAAAFEAVPRGATLFAAGDPADSVILVRKGHVRCLEPAGPKRRHLTVAVAGPWELVGEEAVLPESRYRHSGVAGEASSVQRLPGSDVRRVLKTTSKTFAAFISGLLDDLEGARHLACGSAGPSVAARLATVLVDLSERFGEDSDPGVVVPAQLTHQTLADLAGAHRSTVTTILNEWLYRDILADSDEGLLVARPDDLRAIAEEG